MSADQPTACQLYLMVDVGLDPSSLAQALEGGPVACVLLRGANAKEEALRTATKALRPVAQKHEAAFLVEDRPRLAAESGCDGVHLSRSDSSVRESRQVVGADAIVGVFCGGSRHAGMAAAEAGADYVAFGGGPEDSGCGGAADPDLLSWWQAIMTIPCVATAGSDPETAEQMAAAGADFVAVGRGVWAHPEGPGTAVAHLAALIGGDRPRG